MKNDTLDRFELPHSLRRQFINDCKEMKDYEIDICLSSHNRMTNFLSGLNADDPMDFTGFINPEIWGQFMDVLIAQVEEIDAAED